MFVSKIIKIIDSNGKGNNKDTESIARAMVSQGSWRRLFNELHKNRKLGGVVNLVKCAYEHQYLYILTKPS